MIKLIKSSFYKEKKTKKLLNNFLSSAEQLSFGPECIKFEDNFSRFQKRKFSVFVNSGSSANLAIIQALLNLGKIKKGDKIGFSAVTWSTNVMPIIQLGLKPVPIDVELETLNVSSKKLIEAYKKDKIKLFFITNLLGFCEDLDLIKNFCAEKKIILLEDNCESMGSVYKGKLLGNFSMASTFSFYVGHHMSTIEGGMIVTDDKELADMLRIVRAHGWDRNLDRETQDKIKNQHKVNSDFYSRYTFYDLGFNLRPTEINGFLGNLQLKYVDEIFDKREKNFLYFIKNIYKKSNDFHQIKYKHMDKVSNFAFPLVCKSKEILENLVLKLKNKVEVRPIVGGNMVNQPFFAKYIKDFESIKLPNASLIHQNGFYFANNPELNISDKKIILENIL